LFSRTYLPDRIFNLLPVWGKREPMTLNTVHFLALPPLFCRSPSLHGRMGIWQGVATDSTKFQSRSPCPTLLRLKRPEGGRCAAVFYPFGHPTPYAFVPDPPKAVSPASLSSAVCFSRPPFALGLTSNVFFDSVLARNTSVTAAYISKP
jgi:hypothetical protein